MSQQITTARSREFEDAIRLVAMQEDLRFPGASGDQPTVTGKDHAFDFVGSVELTELLTRHGDTPQQDTPHTRRLVTPRTFVNSDLVATPDRLQMMSDPEGSYVRTMAAALNRRKDQIWIDAYYGSASTGETGGTPVTFPAGNEIAVNFPSGADTGLTQGKLIEAKRLLTAGEAIDGRLFCAITSLQEADLLNIDNFTTIDRNVSKPLTTGIVGTWLGFTFIRTELLPLNGGDRRCPVWSEFGMAFATWEDVFLRISELPTKNHETQVYIRGMFGATRLEEARTMSILCDV